MKHLLCCCVLLASSMLLAQQPAPEGSIASHPGWPEARPADVTSIPAILTALDESISGPAGQPRDWNRLRSLCLPDARLMPIHLLPGSPSSAHPSADLTVYTLDAYIARVTAATRTTGLYERTLHNQIFTFGNLAHVLNTYELVHAPTDPAPFARGINSVDLLRDGDRYWVVSILWDTERPGNPLPAVRP